MPLPHIPPEVYVEIILRVPAKCLIRFRAVCKSWRAFIDDPGFVKAHTDKQLSSNNTLLIRNSTTGGPPLFSFDLDALDFNEAHQTISVTPLDLTPSGLSLVPGLPVATCNGLFLVRQCGTWEIWNPLTDERLLLPQADFAASCAVAWGLGYDESASDDYKAVVITGQSGGRTNVYEYPTYIYSLKSDSWRKAAMNCPWRDNGWRDNGWGTRKDTGVYLSGALHWISRGKVIALDLGTEKYRQWWVPRFQERHGDKELVHGSYHLVVLDGRLMVSDYGYGSKNYDVWVMKDCGVDQEDSWIKLFSMSPDFVVLHDRILSGLRPVAFLKNKTQIFMQCYSGFYLFDVNSLSMKVVRIHGLTGKTYAQIFHWSIFRLHDNCGVGGRVKTQRTRITKRASMSKISDHTEFCFCVRKPKFYNSWKEEEEDRLRDICGSGDND